GLPHKPCRSARIARWRAILADRPHHLPGAPFLPLHMDGDHRMRRGHQQPDVEKTAEKRTKDDHEKEEERLKAQPDEKKPERRQQCSQEVNHHPAPPTNAKSVGLDLGFVAPSAIASMTGG